MMHGHEKSDLVIVAMKPANKAKKAPLRRHLRGRSQRDIVKRSWTTHNDPTPQHSRHCGCRAQR